VYTKAELYDLAMVFSEHPDIFIISDEIYELINFSGKHESIAQFDFIRDRVIIINGVSKGFAMTGWRLGYMAAHRDIAKACDKIQGQVTSGASSISQRAALAAMLIDPEQNKEVNEMRAEFLQRRNLLLDLLSDVPGLKTYVPDGAFYLFPNVTFYFGKAVGDTVINDANDLCMYLLDKAHVALVPGDAFGCPSCLRFSYATSRDKIRESVRRIKEALEALK
ncbi:MAG: aminotransferase class I/II-fold pyridoxal phosphate-dependent enzyme, partial [Bacteroidales bacterium]|nr:aminotransferase class I/II-fold pyridoxal phosphate-dependent enzyme [Bacteroidales bacterium]